MHRNSRVWILICIAVLFLDLAIWQEVLFVSASDETRVHFLDVGQGDAELLELSGGVRILIDAGPRGEIIPALERSALLGSRYLDLVIITHPEADHFGGLAEIATRYRIGAVLVNGRTGPDGAWTAALSLLEEQNVPVILIGKGDVLRIGDSSLSVISPDLPLLGSAALNDTGLVTYLSTPDFSLLLPADIDVQIEKLLVGRGLPRADILKLPHHGSALSGGVELFQAVQPKLAVIEVGENNRYGHPDPELLSRLSSVLPKVRVVRTDESGNITIFRDQGELVVQMER